MSIDCSKNPNAKSIYELSQRGARIRVYLGTLQPAVNDVTVKILFDTKEWDIKDEFSIATNEFIAKEAGYYYINAHAALFPSSLTGELTMTLRINDNYRNNSYVGVNVWPSSTTTIHCSDTQYLNIGDKVTVEFHHKCGGNKFLVGIPDPQSMTTLTINKL